MRRKSARTLGLEGVASNVECAASLIGLGRYWICGLAVVMGFAAASRAAVTLHVQDITVTSNPTTSVIGSFNIYAEVTGAAPDLTGYQVRLYLSPFTSGISFINVTNTFSAPGIPSVFTTSPVVFPSAPGTLMFDNLPSFGSAPLGDGYGLGRVVFSLSPGASGDFDIILDTDPQIGTILSDLNSNPVPFSAVNGSISIVPEPSSLAAVAAMMVHTLRRSRTARKTT